MSKPEKKALVPALRFPEFRDAALWENKVFEEAFRRLTTKNSENNQNALTISAQQGLVSQLEYFNKKIAAKDLSGYYLLRKGDFAYNKSYSQGYPMGAIKPLKFYDKGVVSTLYICFRAKKEFNESFFEHYFETGLLNSEIGKIAQEGGRAHGLLNVSVKEFFKNVKLLIPEIDEQQKIADCLSSIDDLITAQTQKLAALKAHKKGLMQQLFPAEGETVPELRFPEFRDGGEWESEQLGNIGKVSMCKRIMKHETSESGDIPFYKIGTFGKKADAYISKEIYDLYRENFSFPKAGDILISASGTIGRTVVFDGKPAYFQDSNIVWIDNDGSLVSNAFLVFIYQKIKWVTDDNTIARLYNDNLRKIEIIIPPTLEEQKKIADCLDSIDELITAQNQKIEALKSHKKGLMQQLFPSMDEVDG